jgi:hypothetical protein
MLGAALLAQAVLATAGIPEYENPFDGPCTANEARCQSQPDGRVERELLRAEVLRRRLTAPIHLLLEAKLFLGYAMEGPAS